MALRAAKTRAQAQYAMMFYQEQQSILRVVQAYLSVLQPEANGRAAAE
ncbi:hypothetical protein MPNT_90054 [Candidatus Methylacidithermus pantelleriae]|uniref:Uncharacterized protein n=1 Tax=Candidatus Methylacidithermus pantelleriae TaxID=2744239 RepID=A0A8J2FV07_9BACT|nr:hypothetical protein MPNT_90054 [Candidatus Methylacidithermus pantelleriae]